MKNVNPNMLKTCIFMFEAEFEMLIFTLTDGMAKVEAYAFGGVYIVASEKGESKNYEPTNEEILQKLSDYFDVTVTSFHADECDKQGIWICYKENKE